MQLSEGTIIQIGDQRWAFTLLSLFFTHSNREKLSIGEFDKRDAHIWVLMRPVCLGWLV